MARQNTHVVAGYADWTREGEISIGWDMPRPEGPEALPPILISRDGLKGIRRRVNELLALVPPLLTEDAVGLAIEAVHAEMLKDLHTRNASLDKRVLERVLSSGVEAVVHAHGEAVADAGFCSVGCSEEERVAASLTAWSAWSDQAQETIRDALSRARRGEPVSARERLLVPLWDRLSTALADGEVFISDTRAGLRLWHGAEEWQKLAAEEKDEDAVVAELLVQVDEAPSKLCFVNAKGVLRIGKRQLRDRLGRRRSRPRPLSLDQPATSGDGFGTLQDQIPDETAQDAAEALEAAEEARAVQEARAALRVVVGERRARQREGSARWHVLSNFEGLLSGRTRLTDVAKNSGMAMSSVSAAFQQERARVFADPRLRRFRQAE